MKKSIEMKIGDKKIVAEIISWKNGIPGELYVYLRDNNDVIIQDICMVREHYYYNPQTEEFETNEEFIDCKVWADSNDEDYTNEFVIGVYDEEEE